LFATQKKPATRSLKGLAGALPCFATIVSLFAIPGSRSGKMENVRSIRLTRRGDDHHTDLIAESAFLYPIPSSCIDARRFRGKCISNI